ncbi:outer dense fiber protein 3 isoform X2 [Nematostella vectensis]|uniref:outer dense fiber protein 3 isoform X2 n=1 Tax=Nematostella vectensis TaxID=45351 RepID=UPI002077934B|nr:outer dense fiber protein 3 isoform X2 [Nematostella vectensis]
MFANCTSFARKWEIFSQESLHVLAWVSANGLHYIYSVTSQSPRSPARTLALRTSKKQQDSNVKKLSEEQKMTVDVDCTEKEITIAAKCRGPGPAKYLLPGTVGKKNHDVRKTTNPAFSFGQRHRDFFTQISPGPKYMVPSGLTQCGKDGTPAFSLYSRAKEKNLSHVPGPGEYSPEKHSIPHERKAPSYSFGSRTKYAQKQITPSPNSYSLPALTGPKVVNKASAAAYSLTGRSNNGGFSEDLQKTPGPGTYKVTSPDKYRKRMAAYSMNGRNFMPGDSTQKPGPGQHSPEKVVINRHSAPACTFGIRHTEYITLLKC